MACSTLDTLERMRGMYEYRNRRFRARFAIAAAWLFLTGYLAIATLAVNQLVRPFVG